MGVEQYISLFSQLKIKVDARDVQFFLTYQTEALKFNIVDMINPYDLL